MALTDEQLAALDEQVLANLGKPRRVRGDAGEVEMHSIDDQIKARNALKAERVAASGRIGVRLFQIKPPGAV